MALTPLGQDTISKGAQKAKTLLDMLGALKQLNILYDSGGGLKDSIVQADLDAVPGLSGLTETQLDDGMYVLTAVILPAIENNVTQLTHLANRA